MAFTFEEFPSSDYYNSDLRKILEYMRKFEATLKEYDVVIADLKRELENIGGLYDRVALLEQATSDLNEIRSNISALITGLENLANKEQADIDDLDRRIVLLSTAMSGFVTSLKQVYSYIDYELAKRDKSMRTNVKYLEGMIASIEVYLQNQIDYLRWRLEQIDTSVINPWHSELGRVNQDENAKLVYLDLADNELTAEEYAKLGLTADSYVDLDITAYEYARRGKQVTHFNWVYNPVKGWRQEISNVLTALCNYCKDTLTATEYADLQMSAESYANLRLTAKDYYEFNPAHIGLYEKDGTLQSRQFDLIEENGVLIIQRGTATETDGVLSVEA